MMPDSLGKMGKDDAQVILEVSYGENDYICGLDN